MTAKSQNYFIFTHYPLVKLAIKYVPFFKIYTIFFTRKYITEKLILTLSFAWSKKITAQRKIWPKKILNLSQWKLPIFDLSFLTPHFFISNVHWEWLVVNHHNPRKSADLTQRTLWHMGVNVYLITLLNTPRWQGVRCDTLVHIWTYQLIDLEVNLVPFLVAANQRRGFMEILHCDWQPPEVAVRWDFSVIPNPISRIPGFLGFFPKKYQTKNPGIFGIFPNKSQMKNPGIFWDFLDWDFFRVGSRNPKLFPIPDRRS